MGKIAKKCSFWHLVITLQLKENNRVKKYIEQNPDKKEAYIEHAKFLMRVGEGTEPVIEHENLMPGCIEIPQHYLLDEKANEIEDLLKFVFPEIFGDISEIDLDHERAILCPINKDVDEVNEIALKFLSQSNNSLEIQQFCSADSVQSGSKDTLASFLPIEFINTLTPNGMPNHRLKLFNGYSNNIFKSLIKSFLVFKFSLLSH